MTTSNRWNKLIYRLWSPVYDTVLGPVFRRGRQLAHQQLALRPGESVCVVGVGTGADLRLLPTGVTAVGIDLSPDMLARAARILRCCPARIQLVRGDVQNLLTRENLFDTAILNLILTVVPDGNACLRTALQALKPGGRLVVFDKFQPDTHRPSAMRKIINVFSSLLGTDISRSFAQLLRDCPGTIESDTPALFNGFYRVILVRKR